MPIALHPMLRDVARVDVSQISYVTALRNAAGVVAPLAVGAATGHLLPSLTVATGALNVAFSDRPGPYRLRAGRMLLAGACSALSVCVGSAMGSITWLAVPLVMMWGFGGALLVALGAAATQIGLTSVVLLLVFGGQSLAAGHAVTSSLLIFGGGLLQTVLAVAAWPVRPFGPQRAVLAGALRSLAAYPHASPVLGSAPPVTAEMSEARATLSGLDGEHSAAGEAYRSLLDQAERMRLELLALDDARQRLGGAQDDAELRGQLGKVMDAASCVLAALADELDPRPAQADAAALLHRFEAETRALRHVFAAQTPDRPRLALAVLARAAALGGQLRAAVELVAQQSPAGEHRSALLEAARPPALRPREPLSILRANLTLRSAACRHAIRLATCLGIADVLARLPALPRAYWLPMTVAIVLKPDFAATFTRGLGRLAGTILGLLLATALVYAMVGQVAGRVVLAGILVFAVRSLGPANYGLTVTAITALVVVLTSFAGADPGATILERGGYTLVGGALALAAYAAWPTWERTQTPALMADLLEAYRRYFAAVMVGYLDPPRYDAARVEAVRQAARLARSNAAASVDRLRGEPVGSAADLDLFAGLLAASHRFAHSAMTLEADLHGAPAALAPPALHVLVGNVESSLQTLAAAVRRRSWRLGDLPDLRADQQALAGLDSAVPAASAAAVHAKYRLSVIAAEADRIANSVNTMAQLLCRRATE